jgi:hypothetical protein
MLEQHEDVDAGCFDAAFVGDRAAASIVGCAAVHCQGVRPNRRKLLQ